MGKSGRKHGEHGVQLEMIEESRIILCLIVIRA